MTFRGTIKGALLTRGYHIIKDFFVLNDYLDAVAGASVAVGNKTTRYFHLLGTNPVFTDILLNTRMMDIAYETLGRYVNLSEFQIHVLEPGAPSINPHIDYPFVMMEKPFEQMVSVQSILALDDFTESNGATRIVPYSHKFRTWPDQKCFDRLSKKILLNKGDLLLLHGGIWHDTADNDSDGNRGSALITFCQPWIRRLSRVDKNIVDKNDLHDAIKGLIGMKNTEYLNQLIKLKQNQAFEHE